MFSGPSGSSFTPQNIQSGWNSVAAAGGSPQAAVDGVLTSEQVAASALDAIGTEQFLILPHPEVATYERRRADDRERWLRGMRRMQARLAGPA